MVAEAAALSAACNLDQLQQQQLHLLYEALTLSHFGYTNIGTIGWKLRHRDRQQQRHERHGNESGHRRRWRLAANDIHTSDLIAIGDSPAECGHQNGVFVLVKKCRGRQPREC